MRLEVDDWVAHIGQKADIVNGEVVLAENGFLEVTENPKSFSVYVDRSSGTAVLIVPKEDWRGRKYRFRVQDCVVLTCLWMDDYCGSDTLSHARQVTRAEYIHLNENGYDHILEKAGYVLQDRAPEHGDLLVYENHVHIGVCLDGDKILHHLPLKLSCIDPLDPSLILKVFRHAQALH
jgi:hypothetical protein